MAFNLKYHPDVKSADLPRINVKMRERIRRAIESPFPNGYCTTHPFRFLLQPLTISRIAATISAGSIRTV
jgi:hypothetical protein